MPAPDLGQFYHIDLEKLAWDLDAVRRTRIEPSVAIAAAERALKEAVEAIARQNADVTQRRRAVSR